MQSQLKTTAFLETAFDSPEVIETATRLDSTTAPLIQQTASLLIQNGARQLVIDASRTNFMTGSGLRAILAIARQLQKAKGQLAICNLAGQPRTMFDTCGFDNMIALFTRQQDALNALEA